MTFTALEGDESVRKIQEFTEQEWEDRYEFQWPAEPPTVPAFFVRVGKPPGSKGYAWMFATSPDDPEPRALHQHGDWESREAALMAGLVYVTRWLFHGHRNTEN